MKVFIKLGLHSEYHGYSEYRGAYASFDDSVVAEKNTYASMCDMLMCKKNDCTYVCFCNKRYNISLRQWVAAVANYEEEFIDGIYDFFMIKEVEL